MTEYAVDLGRGFSVLQDTEGYRFTQDPVICANLLSAGSRDRLLDLGCGVGIIAILALLKKGVKEAVGVELDPRAAELARRNAERCGLKARMSVLCADVRDAAKLLGRESFDKAVCNPPYFDFEDGTDGGRNAAAKRESGAVLDDFVAAASALVLEYSMTSSLVRALRSSEKDVVLAEPISIASTFTLLVATMLCGGQFSFTNRVLEVCGSLQPTILSASNNSYFQIFNELLAILKATPITSFLLAPLRRLLANTQYFKFVRQRRISELLGDNLRLALSFYSYRPLSQDGHRLL